MLDEKETTVFKRALDEQYHLKLKASRLVFSEINKKFPTMPFSIRLLDNKTSRLGLVECLAHSLLHPYPVLHEKVRFWAVGAVWLGSPAAGCATRWCQMHGLLTLILLF